MSQPGNPPVQPTKKKDGTMASRAKNCAECRRLKLKCDRLIPCSNCIRRGTSSICPDGQLASKSHRVAVANTEELQTKIEELSARIEELEDALAKLQSMHSDDPHPLLDTSKNDEKPLTTSFGSLRLHEDGTKRFYGATSSFEWTMSSENETDADLAHLDSTRPYGEPLETVPELPHPLNDVKDQDIINAYYPMPPDETAIDSLSVKEGLIEAMPSKEEAVVMINQYYDKCGWEMMLVPRTELFTDYFAPCYDRGALPGMQRLALLYGVFANGMLHNTTVPNSSMVAAQYLKHSRACLALDSVISNTTITAINTLLLHITYYHASDEARRGANAEVTLGMTMQLALSIGLQCVVCPIFIQLFTLANSRDPSMWNLPPEEAARRRRTMWELVTLNLWISLVSGRPPLISKRHFDVKIPSGALDVTEPDPNFSRGKHHFSEACLWNLLDLCLAPTSRSSYNDVLTLDAKIRKWTPPPKLHAPERPHPPEQTTIDVMRGTTVVVFREVCLMCLHRAYFARAILEPPFDPLGGVYSRSVLAAYASACAIIGRVRGAYEKEPIAMMKNAFYWTNAFSAAVILCSITIRAPDCALASTALAEFDTVLSMFEKEQASAKASGYPRLLLLRTQAQEAVMAFKTGKWTRPTTTDSQLFLGLGAAGAVVHNIKSHSSPSSSSSGSLDRSDVMASLEDFQPSLNEYLQSLQYQPPMETSEIFNQTPTSDAFLYGVLDGGQGNTIASGHPIPPQPPNPLEYPLQTPPVPTYGNLNQAYPQADFQPTSSIPIISPDLGVPPPFIIGATNNPGAQATAEDLHSAFLWDNFLFELGVQNSNQQ